MSFAARLRQLIDEKSKGNVAAFARLCGVEDSSIRQYLSGTKPSFDSLVAISASTGTSLDWLMAGKESENYPISQNHPRLAMADASGSDDYLPVDRLMVTASAGAGAFNPPSPEVESVRIPSWVLHRLGLKPAVARVIASRGISMMPTIGDGDLLVVDVSKEHRIPIDGLIYVLSIDNELLVKRLRRSSSGWILVSDNRELYPEEPIRPGASVLVHGQVRWVDRKLS